MTQSANNLNSEFCNLNSPACGHILSWAGWSMPVREDWRPMRIKGEHRAGSMMIGDAESPIVRVKWFRPKDAEKFDGAAWLKERFKQLGAVPESGAPKPERFTGVGWVRDLEPKEGESRSVWYGWSLDAGIALECVVTNLTDEEARDEVLNVSVAGLQVTSAGEPCRWSLYGIGFVSPAGFELEKKHLYSGDIALQFKAGKERVLLRQVYPAKLAVSRRKLERWLDCSPFKQHRKFKLRNSEPWHLNSGRQVDGIKRQGAKRLPSPLGFCAARSTCAIAAEDKQNDRVLIAEHIVPGECSGDLVGQAIASMN
jgi:hypothetical protein